MIALGAPSVVAVPAVVWLGLGAVLWMRRVPFLVLACRLLVRRRSTAGCQRLGGGICTELWWSVCLDDCHVGVTRVALEDVVVHDRFFGTRAVCPSCASTRGRVHLSLERTGVRMFFLITLQICCDCSKQIDSHSEFGVSRINSCLSCLVVFLDGTFTQANTIKQTHNSPEVPVFGIVLKAPFCCFDGVSPVANRDRHSPV